MSGVTPQPELTVNEIYASIQGESTRAGLPCVFVRLTGCNLRCSYCDTEYAFYDGSKMSVDAVVEQVTALGLPLVEITGGEPLLQPACVPLAGKLLEAGLTVLIETSGALPIDKLPAGTIRIVDFKCPSSGECERNDWTIVNHLTAIDEVKFVIGDRADFDWACAVLDRHNLAGRCPILFSPVFGKLQPRPLAEWILASKLDVRMQLQMHKFIWDPAERGV